MARGNFYENNDTMNGSLYNLINQLTIIKEVIQIPLLHYHQLELDKNVSDSNF